MLREIEINGDKYGIYTLEEIGKENIHKLPFSLRVLLENLLRHKYEEEEGTVEDKHIENIILRKKGEEIPFFPERVILQDFTGVPLITDLAVMRDVVKKFGKNPKLINPVKQCDLVIDHSIQVDFYGTSNALEFNIKKEFERNRERYEFLKWAQNAFKNMRIIPPGTGIIHQVNLEFLASVVLVGKSQKTKSKILFPDTVFGTDSHTTMINSLGVLGWGVGGIEAEVVMLGEPNYITVPEVIGVKLTGKPNPTVTATDIVLTITEILRKYKVVDKFVEFFGDVKDLSIPDRATISNMCPEYGARCAFFPVDDKVLRYLELTGRPKKHIRLVEEYLRRNLMFQDYSYEPEYDKVVEIRLDEIEPSAAGPSRPHDRVPLKSLKSKFYEYIGREPISTEVELDHIRTKIGDGAIVLAAITSCTNTSNPELMIQAGILAKKAVDRGLNIKPYVKTSNAPGSRVVSGYLEKAGLMPYLQALGFHITGYGCTVCIGNSGSLNPSIENTIKEKKITAVSVLSGNRNFEARIHPAVRANYLMSPAMVVAFAIAGKIDIDIEKEPIGFDPNGIPVYLKDIYPTKDEVEKYLSIVERELYVEKYKNVFEGVEEWQKLQAPSGELYSWDEKSTYIKPPPFFENFEIEVPELQDIYGARALILLGDSITTDHISPAGNISEKSPAGQYLIEKGVSPAEFNNYGSRRGNWEVMVRGTFSNPRIKNLMFEDGREGGYTIHYPSGKIASVFEVAYQLYKDEGIPLIIIAGKEYGSGSSRDWAAKGTALLGVKVVIAESFETIHRSNLVGMGVVPLKFKDGNIKKLEIKGNETFNIPLRELGPNKEIEVEMVRETGEVTKFLTIAQLNTEKEVEYIRHGGILHYVLRKLLKTKKGRKRSSS